MAEVTLLKRRRLNLGGVLFKRGETVPMEDHLAVVLENDDRFRVRGIRLTGDERRARAADGAADGDTDRRPMGDTLTACIAEAIDQLNTDDDDAYDRHGKPSLQSLSAILGYQITAQERDRALTQGRSRGHLDAASQPATGPTAAGLKLPKRLSPEQKADLAAKAAVINGSVTSGNDKAVERQEQAAAEPGMEF